MINAILIGLALIGQVETQHSHWFVISRPNGTFTYLWGTKDSRGYVTGVIPPPGAPELATISPYVVAPSKPVLVEPKKVGPGKAKDDSKTPDPVFPDTNGAKVEAGVLNFGVETSKLSTTKPGPSYLGEVRGTDQDVGRDVAKTLKDSHDVQEMAKPKDSGIAGGTGKQNGDVKSKSEPRKPSQNLIESNGIIVDPMLTSGVITGEDLKNGTPSVKVFGDPIPDGTVKKDEQCPGPGPCPTPNPKPKPKPDPVIPSIPNPATNWLIIGISLVLLSAVAIISFAAVVVYLMANKK